MTEKKKLFHLTYPIFLESLLFSVIGSVDVLMLSRYHDSAVGAVGVVNQLIFLILIGGSIILTGTGILLSQAIGAKKSKESLQKLVLTALIVNLFMGILFSFAFVLFSESALSRMNLQGEMLVFAKEYLVIVGGFIFLQLLAMTFSMFLRSFGKTKVTLKVSILTNLCNVFLNYLLIYGHLGFSSLGVRGAAIATILSRGLGMVMLGRQVQKLIFAPIISSFSLNDFKDYLPRILKFGLPAAGEQISYNLARFVMIIMVTRLGEVSINAYSYSNTLISFVYIFAVALGHGTSIMVGWSFGAKRYAKARELTSFSSKASLLISMTACLILVLFRFPLLRLLTNSPSIITLASKVLLLNFILEAGRSQNLIFVNALRAISDVKFPFQVGILSMWGIGVPLAYFFSFSLQMGLTGIWLALGIDEITRSLLMRIRWSKNMQKLNSPYEQVLEINLPNDAQTQEKSVEF